MWQPDKLSSLDSLLAHKWKKFANTLEIEIISPFKIVSNEMPYVYAVSVIHFGLKSFPRSGVEMQPVTL
jgi:hypothetical protein